MGKGFFISKAVGVGGIIVGVAALSTIIALSVVYSQERSKNNNQIEETTTQPPVPVTTLAPSNEPWDQYRLPKTLLPLYYNVTLWPRLKPDPVTGLYIFTGKALWV